MVKAQIIQITTRELYPNAHVGWVQHKLGRRYIGNYVGGNPTEDKTEAKKWARSYAAQIARMTFRQLPNGNFEPL